MDGEGTEEVPFAYIITYNSFEDAGESAGRDPRQRRHTHGLSRPHRPRTTEPIPSMKAMKPAAPPTCDRGGMRPTYRPPVAWRRAWCGGLAVTLCQVAWSILCITTPPAPMHAPMPALRSSVLSAICAAACKTGSSIARVRRVPPRTEKEFAGRNTFDSRQGADDGFLRREEEF